MAKKKPAGPKSADGSEYRTMRRSEIKGHPRNPRKISPLAAAKLRDSIRATSGLVDPPIFNVRTGHLVAGHQRLNQTDTLMGEGDYELTVSVVDWDEKTEAEFMIRHNIHAGEWDVPLLGELLRDEELNLDLSETGISPIELEQLYLDAGMSFLDGAAPQVGLSERAANLARTVAAEAAAVGDEAAGIEAARRDEEDIEKIKAAKAAFRERAAAQHDVLTYFVAVFPSSEDKADFLQAIGLNPQDEMIDGPNLAARCGVEYQEPKEPE